MEMSSRSCDGQVDGAVCGHPQAAVDRYMGKQAERKVDVGILAEEVHVVISYAVTADGDGGQHHLFEVWGPVFRSLRMPSTLRWFF